MKITFITIMFWIVALSTVSAQLFDELNDLNDPLPFSLRSGIREKIKPELMEATYVTKAYNNDSLLLVMNPPGTKRLKAGIVIDTTAYNFKDVSNYYDVGHGNLWLCKLTSPTAKELSVAFEKFDIPNGALLSCYQLNNSSPFIEGTGGYYTDNWEYFLGAVSTMGNELFIEYYEPKEVTDTIDLIFKDIVYFFTDGIGVSLDDILKKKVDTDNPLLKSGSWGSSAFDCDNKLPCSSVSQWSDIAKSVVYIRVTLNDYSVSHGTGFLVNRSSGYSASDKPYIITCGHLFPDGSNVNSYRYLDYYVNYEDHKCDDFWPRSGTRIRGFDILEFGTSSNLDPNSTSYYESDDFALLQSGSNIEDLAKYNVQYAGWTTSHNYSNNGYAYIGHPKGDVKTVNEWNSYAPLNRTEKFFAVYNNVGVGEEGFSGSPVFSTISNKVVGWVCTKENGTFTCGDGDQYTHCGLFDELHPYISSHVDPSNTGSASYSNPTLSLLPDHCTDCESNYDETGIDCGGSCQPCGMADDFTATTTADIYGREKINARFDLNVDGGGTSIEFQNQNYVLTAGESVKLKSTKISNGATFKASVNAALMYSEMQGCQEKCFSYLDIVDQTDDGYLDFLIGKFAFINKYKITVWPGAGYDPVFTSGWINLYGNEIISMWDGEGVIPGAYRALVEIYDCIGNYYQYPVFYFSLVVDGNISKSLPLTTNNGMDEIDYDLIIYPNPVSSLLKVELNPGLIEGNDSYLIVINDVWGKTVLQNNFCDFYNEIDISNFNRGTYVLTVETKDKVYSKRFVKD